MKTVRLLPVLALMLILPGLAGGSGLLDQCQFYYWVWWRNLEDRWQELIDFSADHKMDGVVIWGLQGWKGDGARAREVVRYAHRRGVRVIHGLGLNGYEVGKHIVAEHPELKAVIPAALVGTTKGKWSREAVFCPSKPKSMELLRQFLIQAADTGIDGFNFETADVDYITCHCSECEKRFDSRDETEGQNKPIGWPLEHLRFAADVLAQSHPHVWLNCEFAMQRFGTRPYTDCERILQLNRQIDPRLTVVWAESWAPPDAIARKLRAERENVGFYIRSGAIYGWDAKSVLPSQDLLPIARRLLEQNPVCIMYRSYRPLDRWALNMAAASRILHTPTMDAAELKSLLNKLKLTTAPGGPYSFVRHIAPGNLIAPDGPAKLTVSSGDAIRLVDGVAEPGDGIWRTERNSPKEAFATAEWPEPMTVARVRLFHQKDGHYRSLDYAVQYWADSAWQNVDGMPIRDNAAHGWVKHEFAPVQTTRMRIHITRSKYGNRMAIGEWEVYGP